jgi:hypothetical protein
MHPLLFYWQRFRFCATEPLQKHSALAINSDLCAIGPIHELWGRNHENYAWVGISIKICLVSFASMTQLRPATGNASQDRECGRPKH